MWMIQRGHRTRFAFEALIELLPADFDSHDAIQARITRLPHFAHASRADRRVDFVRTQSRSGRQWHNWPILPNQNIKVTLLDVGCDNALSPVAARASRGSIVQNRKVSRNRVLWSIDGVTGCASTAQITVGEGPTQGDVG